MGTPKCALYGILSFGNFRLYKNKMKHANFLYFVRSFVYIRSVAPKIEHSKNLSGKICKTKIPRLISFHDEAVHNHVATIIIKEPHLFLDDGISSGSCCRAGIACDDVGVRECLCFATDH